MQIIHAVGLATILVFVMLCSACGKGTAVKKQDAAVDPYYDIQTNLSVIHMESAWNEGITGKGVVIALIDSGIAPEHEDIDYTRISGKSYVGDASDLSDNNGHGTFIAGILAATRGNGIGIAGMTDSDIVVLKVFDSNLRIDADNISQAIYDATDLYGAQVINLSMGTSQNVRAIQTAIEYASDKGVIIIAACGGNKDTTYYPAAYDCVVGVEALNADLTPISGYAVDNTSVYVTAPGENIIGLKANVNGYDVNGAGASYAAAHVTALAAMAKQIRPDVNASEFMELLKQSAIDYGDPGYDTLYGWGLLDVSGFLKAIKG